MLHFLMTLVYKAEHWATEFTHHVMLLFTGGTSILTKWLVIITSCLVQSIFYKMCGKLAERGNMPKTWQETSNAQT